MARHGEKPFIHVSDSNGNPYVGAKLHVYEVGTTTYRDIFSDDGLTTPLANPLTGANASDASGNFPRFYTAAGTYKLRAVTSADVLIFEYDDIDTGMPSGGVSAFMLTVLDDLTAAAARTTLGVPSTTELNDLASDVADVQASVQGIVSVPQGRLTLTSLTPVLSTGVTAGTAVYYTPYLGSTCPVWNGTQFIPTTFSELTLTLSANHVANAIYDCFFAIDGGNNVLGTGPAWNTATAGAGARGSGAGTTGLVREGGLWVNEFEITLRNGAATYTIPAKQATYLGTIVIDGTNGQITQHVTWGASRLPGPWNAYNRLLRVLKAGDSTASWTYNSATIRQSRATATNTIRVLSGLPEDTPIFRMQQTMYTDTTASSTVPGQSIGIGYNSTTAISGVRATIVSNAGALNIGGTYTAEYIGAPFIGINNINSLESSVSTNTVTFYGTEGNMVLSSHLPS